MQYISPTADSEIRQRLDQLQINTQQLIIDDMPVAAAKLLWNSADAYPPPHASDLRLQAIGILFDSRNPLRARLYLSHFSEDNLNARQLLEKRLYDAHFMMQTKRPDQVSDSLPLELVEQAAPQLRIRAYRFIADAAAQTGDIVSVIQSHLALEGLLSDEQLPDNTLSLWRMLVSAPPPDAAAMATHPDNRVRAWLELARLASPGQVDIPRLETDLALWKARNDWADLPSDVDDELYRRWQYLDFKPGQIALLLPLTGAYGKFGQAVKGGFMNMHEASSPTFTIRVYNTDQERTIVELYRLAVSEGAELIIGPLLAEQLARLVDEQVISISTLSLNYHRGSDSGPVNDHVQFGLLPEDEAVQVARRMWDNNHHYALVLTPNDDWGARLARSFVREYSRLGGVVRETMSYNPALVDYSSDIRTLLQIDESVARHKQIQSILGKKVRGTPRIRQDIHAAALFADAEHAKQIYPQIKYHFADTLPVYASSHIYHPKQKIKRELDGIMYCDIPFIFNREHSVTDLPRLYALGMDAYRLIGSFRLIQISDVIIPGQTGLLSSPDEQRIFRTLNWAKFEQGRPVPVQHIN